MCTNPRRAQRGTTRTEALIAFLVLSLGMIGLARMQGQLRLDADAARQRTEAIRLAQDELETLRSTRPFAAIANATRVVSLSTIYRIDRMISPTDAPNAVAVTIAVSWTDRGRTLQGLALDSVLAGTDPRLSGALALASR